MYWINGIISKSISLNNRAIHFGDGFFTTSKIEDGQVIFISQHMKRLILSAQRLMFENLDYDLLYKEILQAATYSINGIIKIIIIRANQHNIHGYRFNKNFQPLRIICTYPFPQNYIQWHKCGVRLMISTVRISRNFLFSGIKHLNRLEQVMIAKEIDDNEVADEALVLDTENNIVECCSANIFWRINQQVFTPSVYHAGVNGVIRQLILKLLPSLGYHVQEVMVGVDHIKNINEAFITNSLLPLASVQSINNNIYKDRTLFQVLSTCIMK